MDKFLLCNLTDSVKAILDLIGSDLKNRTKYDIHIAIRRLVTVLSNRLNPDPSPEQTGFLKEIIDQMNVILTDINNVNVIAALNKFQITFGVFYLYSDLSGMLDTSINYNKLLIEEIVQFIKLKNLVHIYDDSAVLSKLEKLQFSLHQIDNMRDNLADVMKYADRNKNIDEKLSDFKENFLESSKQFEIYEIPVDIDPSDSSMGKWEGMRVCLEVSEHNMTNTLAEVQIYKKLQNCQFIAQLFGVSQINKKDSNVVYEYPTNGFLDQWLYSNDINKSLSLIAQSKIVDGIARGLLFMHENKMIHGHLQSNNIILDAFFTPKLKLLPFQAPSKVSLKWKAPEFWSNSSSAATIPGDVFSFGIVFCEIYSKRLPWSNFTNEAEIKNEMEQGATPFTDEQMPFALFTTISKCFYKNPVERPSMLELINDTTSPLSNQNSFHKLIRILNEFYLVNAKTLSPLIPSFVKSVYDKCTCYAVIKIFFYCNMIAIIIESVKGTSVVWRVPIKGIAFLIVAITSVLMTVIGIISWYVNQNISKFQFFVQTVCLILVISNYANEGGLHVDLLLPIVYTILILLFMIYFRIDDDTRLVNYFVKSWDKNGEIISFTNVFARITKRKAVEWGSAFLFLINILTILAVYVNIQSIDLNYVYLNPLSYMPVYAFVLLLTLCIATISSSFAGLIKLHRNKPAFSIFLKFQLLSISLVIVLIGITHTTCVTFLDNFFENGGQSWYIDKTEKIFVCKTKFYDIATTLSIWYMLNIVVTIVLKRILQQNQSIMDIVLPNIILEKKSKIFGGFLYLLLLVPIVFNLIIRGSIDFYYMYLPMTQFTNIAAILILIFIIGLVGLKCKRNIILYINVMYVMAMILQFMVILNKDRFCDDYAKVGNSRFGTPPDEALREYCIHVVIYEGIGVIVWCFVNMVVGWLIHKYGKEGFVQLRNEHEA